MRLLKLLFFTYLKNLKFNGIQIKTNIIVTIFRYTPCLRKTREKIIFPLEI